jgi:predicted enzyme related to lactoylglutathione lyase
MRADGKFDYLELPAKGLPATKAFYEQAFGWRFVDYGPEYAAFEEAGIDGGFHENPAAKLLPVLFATDLEAMEAKVRAAGGTIPGPILSFPGGRRFHFIDPSGNELAVWSES